MNQKKWLHLLLCLVLFFSIFLTTNADEGMYIPNKIDQNLMEKMKKMGFELSLKEIYNPEGTGLANAVVNIGATASFVSPKGLIITAYHVASRATRGISSPDKNYSKTGFLARSLNEELPAKGYQVSVLQAIENITRQVLSSVKKDMTDFERYEAIERKTREIIKKAEQKGAVECNIEDMNYGMEYYLFTFLKLKDIRIVYVPAGSIGLYGGDIDDFRWPRHCGEFAFLRAYVGPDGKPTEYSENNVPYKPKSYLRVSAKGIKENELTILMGYPRQTYRYLTSFAIESDETFRYAFQIKTATDLIHIYKELSKQDKDIAKKLTSNINRLNNRLKSNQALLEALIKINLLERKRAEEKAFLEYVKNKPELEKKYGSQLSQIEALYTGWKKIRGKSALLEWIDQGSPMLSSALSINKWSIERQKKNRDREPGYKEEDLPRIKSRLKVAQSSLVLESDKKGLEYFMKKALTLPPGQKIGTVDKIVSQHQDISQEVAINQFVERLYSQTKLASVEETIKMLQFPRKKLLQINDPFIQFASELEEEREVLNRKRKKFAVALSRLMPVYLEGIQIWKNSHLYPDANGTLRLSFGQVKGYSPRDALICHYLTSLAGVIEKHTGKEPFDIPEKLLNIYQEKDFGVYVDKNIGDVPVNFCSNNDGAGGNSGSPVLNGRGELVGISFDRNYYQAIHNDYYFDHELFRRIQTDTRYILFITEKLDKALNVLEELDIVR